MADLRQLLERSRQELDPRWDERQVERALAGAHIRMKARAARRRAGAALAVFCAVGLGAAQLIRTRGSARATSPEEARRATRQDVAGSAQEIVLADGSTATALTPSSQLVVALQSQTEVALSVRSGGYRFAVRHSSERLFRVGFGAVQVTVLGTAFSVEEVGLGREVDVAVETGRVRVTSPAGAVELGAGEHGRFSTAAPRPPPEPAPLRPPWKRATQRQVIVSSPTPSWKALARAGHFNEAYSILKQVPAAEVADAVEELLLAADAARLSGHPAEAVGFLERAATHREDGRASLAAFTLGKVQLEQLRAPAPAADAFALARALAPDGALAEDALAREAEARWHADQREAARSLAHEYLRRYANGAARSLVEAYVSGQ